MTTKYKSEIELGKKYRDTDTGFTGTAVCVYFFEHGCERVTLKALSAAENKIVEFAFDAPELARVNGDDTTGRQVKPAEKKPGGPHDRAPMGRR